jgi:mRNA interferase RelE/StbE
MTYQVRIERAAGKAFDGLPPVTKQRIAAAIDLLAENPRHFGVIKLADTDNGYRVRIGRYRIVFSIDDAAALVSIVRIATRQGVYKP